MSVAIKQAISTAIPTQENASCANGHMQVIPEANSVFVHSARSRHPPELMSLHQKAKPQHSCTLMLLCFFHATSPATATATSPSSVPGQDQEEGIHQFSMDATSSTKIQADRAKETSGAALQPAWKQWHCSFSAWQELHLCLSPEIPRW